MLPALHRVERIDSSSSAQSPRPKTGGHTVALAQKNHARTSNAPAVHGQIEQPRRHLPAAGHSVETCDITLTAPIILRLAVMQRLSSDRAVLESDGGSSRPEPPRGGKRYRRPGKDFATRTGDRSWPCRRSRRTAAYVTTSTTAGTPRRSVGRPVRSVHSAGSTSNSDAGTSSTSARSNNLS